MNTGIFILILFIAIQNIVDTVLLVYNTENSVGQEEGICLYYVQEFNVKYCIRYGRVISYFLKLNHCFNGKKWLFTELIRLEISPWEVLSWGSSIEKVDDYAHVFYNRSNSIDAEEFLCNCTEIGVFGKYCEYELPFVTLSFNVAIDELFRRKTSKEDYQLWSKILCYETLICDYGMLCLDWRNICDGTQNCMDGLDEENCDKLEFNECEHNEYRCLNGMCIAEEYWLDGYPDCMDWSDETINALAFFCPSIPTTIFDCDDHICLTILWSCGDGQCINTYARHVHQEIFPHDEGCFSMREYSYTCETGVGTRMWTKPNGLCAQYGYNDDSLQLIDAADICVYLIRCALSMGAERKCLCNGTNCVEIMKYICEEETIYPYPNDGIHRPWIKYFYQWNRAWESPSPDITYVIGRFRCRGFLANITIGDHIPVIYKYLLFTTSAIEWRICKDIPMKNQDKSSQLQYSATCWNDSFTFNGQSYAFQDICINTSQCFSQYRIHDAAPDCIFGEDEDDNLLVQTNYCQNIQKHRFQCAPEQMTCLPIIHLFFSNSNDKYGCKNAYDTFIKGDGRALTDIDCSANKEDSECHVLRYYIGNSSMSNSTFTDDLNENNDIKRSLSSIPFQFYCDGFWDEQSLHIDEDNTSCQIWICREDQFQCRTGQCIAEEWVCDGEWDCSDGSDEFNILEEWSNHNKLLLNLNKRKEQCEKKHQIILPFFDFCNFSYEYPCYRASVSNPLNIYKHRPCINVTQIGDGIEDCYGGLDEKNTFKDCSGLMLGYTLQCTNTCLSYPDACKRTDSECSLSYLCSYRSKNASWCFGPKDVICLNGTCIENARCNGKHQCLHGEDEYWCPMQNSLENQIFYRFSKYSRRWDSMPTERLLPFPKENIQKITKTLFQNVIRLQLSTINYVKKDQQEQSSDFFPYICNRGFPIYSYFSGKPQCLCPPSYYGIWCEFFSDRLSVVTHVDLSNIPMNLLTVVVTLNFDSYVIDHHIFYVNRILETKDNIKQRFYLLYSRSNASLKHKRWRFSNRSDIINYHPYSIHFDLYSLNENCTNELGSFRYPLYFDFLPVSRFASILKIPLRFNNTYEQKSLYKPIFNQNDTFYYSCRSGYSGKNCQTYDSQCSSYCSSNSICRPKYRGVIGNPDYPLCICPFGYFGARCNIRHEACKSNPCGFNSTCEPMYDLRGEIFFICICSEQFYGDRCQYEKVAIHIEVNMTTTTTTKSIDASVIQFYNILSQPRVLTLQYQQVIRNLPRTIKYNHGQNIAPTLAILKTHILTTSAKYFLLYVRPNTSIINISSTPEECPYALHLLQSKLLTHIYIKEYPLFSDDTSNIDPIFKYHHICRNDINRICFYDRIYFCLCQPDHKKGVHCFGHNIMIDQCDSCLSNGKCIRGNLNHAKDFICLCPSCHQGRLCENNLEAFGFTLDSLLISESKTIQFIYISLSLILFFIGLFTNFCSFMTFKRKQTRKFGVGNYLFIVTILNQFSLLFLTIKFILIQLGSIGQTNNISCKLVSYLLSIFTRSTFWLTTWITIDRLHMVLYVNSILIKNIRISIYSSIITLFIIFIMHIHEIIFYQVIFHPDTSARICMTNFNQNFIINYNRITTLIHYLLPFCIQIISITFLIILAARSRAKTVDNKTTTTFAQILKKQFSIQKELYITPIIIILSALPQTIITFHLSCISLNNWKRHLLLITFLLSYIPQGLGFLLYVLPSTGYTKEFKQTFIGKKYSEWMLNTLSITNKKTHQTK